MRTDTDNQINLFCQCPTIPRDDQRRPEPRLNPSTGLPMSVSRRFARFHEANPHVLDAIVAIALDLKSQGFRTCGLRLIFERLRWLAAIETRGDGFRINNSFAPYYARLAMDTEPRLEGFFRLRESAADMG